MTEAMPFLQKAILLSYAPRPFAEERLLFSLSTAAPRQRRGPRSCTRGRRWAGNRGSRA